MTPSHLNKHHISREVFSKALGWRENPPVTPMKMQQSPCTHLYPTLSVMNPPMTGPRMGPRNGATE